MPLKVLHVSSGNLYGGVETLLATLSRERRVCTEMEPHFVLCFEGRLSSELHDLGTPARILGPVRMRFPWTISRARRKLRRVIDELRPDVAICHMPWNLAVFGPIFAGKDIPLVFWMHDRALGKHWIERWASWMPPNLVICNSRFTANSLPCLFPRRTLPHEVIYCPIRSPRHAANGANPRLTIRDELATSPTAVVIIQVSRMEPYKGHSLHLEALARLRSIPSWVCWIVGGVQRAREQNYLRHLHAQAAAAGIGDRVRFLGERRDVQRLLSAADIFCQPNLRGEPFGIVFVEALYNRLPVVSTAIGAALEIVDESCGRLVCANSAEDLAEALRQLILDASLRVELAAAGPNRASALSSPVCNLAQLADSLKRCLAVPQGNASINACTQNRVCKTSEITTSNFEL